MVLRTSDGRIILQHRAIQKQRLSEPKPTRGNANYTDVPGASAAGFIDATVVGTGRQPGTPDLMASHTIRALGHKELGEELGLGPEHLSSLKIVALASDKIKVHDEIIMLGETDLTAEELETASRASSRNKNLADADFEEKFIDIPATPEAIATLLCDVRCPVPPTHAAAFVAAGFTIVLENDGPQAAEVWRDQVQQGITKNYATIDKTVQGYYAAHPEALAKVPERYWGRLVPPRNPHGYAPAYGPEEQGLPSFENELIRVGLMKDQRTHVPAAYVFDVDGPLSDPHERRVTEKALFGEIVERLKAGEPVALNSGRSVRWMEERVVAPLLEYIEDRRILERFVVFGEKGGSWLSFDADGTITHGRVANITIGDDLKERVATLVAERYADVVADLDPKDTMISLEMLPGYNLESFTAKKEEIASALRKVLGSLGLDKTFAVDATTIGIDVESPHVGKDLGAERLLQFLRDKGIEAKEYVTYGDSRSDMDMADELVRHGKGNVTFVYVGEKALVPESRKGISVVVPERPYSQGTLQHLLDKSH